MWLQPFGAVPLLSNCAKLLSCTGCVAPIGGLIEKESECRGPIPMHQRTKKDPAPMAGGGAGAAGADIWSTPRAPPSEPPARGRDGSVPPRTWAGRWPVGRPTAFSKRPCAGPPGTSRGGGMRFRRRGSGRPARGLCSSPRSRRPGPDVWPGQVIVVLSARGRLACPGGFRPSTHHGGARFIYVLYTYVCLHPLKRLDHLGCPLVLLPFYSGAALGELRHRVTGALRYRDSGRD